MKCVTRAANRQIQSSLNLLEKEQLEAPAKKGKAGDEFNKHETTIQHSALETIFRRLNSDFSNIKLLLRSNRVRPTKKTMESDQIRYQNRNQHLNESVTAHDTKSSFRNDQVLGQRREDLNTKQDKLGIILI